MMRSVTVWLKDCGKPHDALSSVAQFDDVVEATVADGVLLIATKSGYGATFPLHNVLATTSEVKA